MTPATNSKLLSADKLGIVVIGRNEGNRLVDCLVSLQPLVDFAIVYVDSASTDGSPEKASLYGVEIVRLDNREPFTAARARNEGLAALLHQIPQLKVVQFIDGDCTLDPGWLATALVFMAEHPDIAVVCGRRRERYPEQSVYNRLCDIEWNTPVGEALACGGDSMVRVEAISEVGGFRPELVSGEEPELCGRIRSKGWKIWRLDAEMTRHDAAMTHFSQWWRRAVRSGYGEAEIAFLKKGQGPQSRERREATRSVFWAGVVPVTIIVLAAAGLHRLALAGLLTYPLQIARTAFRRGPSQVLSWYYALFMMIAKFAQLEGNLRYLWDHCRNKRSARPTEYKA